MIMYMGMKVWVRLTVRSDLPVKMASAKKGNM
jgi:hypothetical protein